MGRKERRSTEFSPMGAAVIMALCVLPRLPLDCVCNARKDVIWQLTHSWLHRYLPRRSIDRLPKSGRKKPKKFEDYAIGYFQIDIDELP